MKYCRKCRINYPEDARFCPYCGEHLEAVKEQDGMETKNKPNLFILSLAGSLALSAILIGVFHLPVFILAAVLPLFWLKRKKGN